MKSLTENLLSSLAINEGSGHMSMRMGQGSSGVAYDLGNGYVQKTLRLDVGPSKSIRQLEKKVIDRWAKTKNLKAISSIRNWNGDTYETEKLECPCPEGKLISKCIYNYLLCADPDEWDVNRVTKMKKEVPEADFVLQWLQDFWDDVITIVGEQNARRVCDDIRSVNIGKDKHGNVKCFDWFDPWCSNIKL